MSSPHAPAPKRTSRTGIWVAVGLLVAAVVVAVAAGVVVWRLLSGEVVVVAADGQAHQVDLPADETYGVFVTDGRPVTCEAVAGDGTAISFGPVNGSYEVNEWEADRSFDTADGDLEVTCTALAGDGAEVRLGPLPSIPGLIGTIFGGACLGLFLGAAGLAVLVVTLVRRNRPPQLPPPPYQPPYQG